MGIIQARHVGVCVEALTLPDLGVGEPILQIVSKAGLRPCVHEEIAVSKC